MTKEAEKKIDKLIEETYEVEESIQMKINQNKLKRLLPKKYHKLFDNFLNYDPHMKYTLPDFYKYMGKTTYDIFDYIPLGFDDGNYLTYHIPTKKIVGLYHSGSATEAKPGINPKGEYNYWAEHLNQSLETSPKLFKKYPANDIKKLESDLSKYLGFKVEIHPDEYKNKEKYVEIWTKNDQDMFDNFGSKTTYQKLRTFKNKL
jgi:hypothetical protein